MIRSIVGVEKLIYRNICVSVSRKKHLWSSDNVVRSSFEDVDIPNLSVHEYMWKDLAKWSNKTAVVCGLTNRQYTYEQIYRQSQALGARLRKSFQVKDGDTVAIMLPNIPEYPVTVLGVQAAGGVVSTLNPVYTAHELQRQLQISNPKAIFVINETAGVVKEALKLIKRNIPIIAINLNNELPADTIRYTELVDTNIDLSVLKEVRYDVNEVAFLHYSSGTTGLPKGVELTHRNVVANSEQQNTELKLFEDTTESNQDVALAILPMFHSYGLNIVMFHKLSVGLKLVTLPRFEPETMVNVMTNHKFDLLYLAPPLVLFLGSYPQITSKHFERLRCVVSGAAPLPQADLDRLLGKAVKNDVHFSQGYGLTEVGPLATLNPIGYKNYKSVGLALPNIELRIVDGNLNNLGPNEVGELLIKGPNVMKGYKNNPEANKDVFVEGSWLRSGDLGSIDETGSVYILDRLKELIKVSGFQVPPAELESELKLHPGVFDAAVIGVKDPKSGERPKAFVVLNEGFKTSDEEIMKFVNERVAPYKKIKELVFLESIPKNASGKILRRMLVQKFT
ncbi:uncharacterized protein [Epargyreus clarus]|uniref:uncharacterized protein n=1 Tax=Epargyreus clarus TaxID=520877 RepID=UPI003C2B9CD0